MSRRASGRPRGTISIGAAVVAAVVIAACGGDDDSASTTAAVPETEATETEPDDPADGDDPEAPPDDEGTTDDPADGDDPGGTSGSEFATIDEIAALCPADEAPDRLVFSVWDGHEELISPAFAAFTEATGVEVEFLNNSLGDRLTRMAAERGSPTIDVALVPINEAPALLANGIVDPADPTIPNYDLLLPVAQFDSGYGTSVLQFGIAYNPEFVTTVPTSWADLFDPAYSGQVAFPQMPNSGGYAALSMLNQLAGGDDSDLTAGIETVADHLDDIALFYPSTVAVEPQIISGEIWIYPDIGGAVMAAIDRGVPVEFVVPDEGGPAGLNTLVVPAGNDSPGCVKAFVSYFLGEEIQEAYGTALYYGSVNTAFEAPEDVVVWPNDNETIVELDWPVLAENVADTMDVWNRLVIG